MVRTTENLCFHVRKRENVQTPSGAHPPSYATGTVCFFPRDKAGGKLTNHLHLVPGIRCSRKQTGSLRVEELSENSSVLVLMFYCNRKKLGMRRTKYEETYKLDCIY